MYLICAILSCVPDRQRTLRELELGRTLVLRGANYVIQHGPDDYKTGAQYGERPPLVIAPHVKPYLDAYLGKWRAFLTPSHGFVFSKKNGAAPTSGFIYSLFTAAMYRLTGKKTNPHFVRDIIVTHLKESDASERDLEALAIYMGHSSTMQRTTYDRRTKGQKVAPAVQLLQSLFDKQ